MEFWKCLNEGKGLFLPEELELPEEVVNNNTSNCVLVSSQESIGGQEFIQFGFPDLRGRIRQDPLSDRIGLDCYNEVASPTCASPDVGSQDRQLGSRMPSLFVGSDCLELGTVDLKLGGLADSKGLSDAASSVISTLPVPTKRSRLTSSYTHTPVCQVHGCNKDLSSFKDYYKRHKVCDAHTKTAKVIVKGIEQRFCQQCSRFHLVDEFDDGKRSCRKRLANHNERRRKSPGTRFLRSSSMRTSFLLQEMCPTATPGPSKHEQGKWLSHMKFEDPIQDSNALLNFHDTNAGIAVPSDQDFPRIPDSSRALSLLSAQSNHNYNSSAQGLLYYSSANSQFNSPGKAEPTTTVPDEGILIGSNTSSSDKYFLPSGQGTVVDLLQLSTHLQMVERKRENSMH